jgi:hypothetical protein
MKYTSSTTGLTASTGHLYFLAHVLGEIHRSGIVGGLAEPMLRHVLKAARGAWESAPTKYLAGWLQHSLVGGTVETWKDIADRTFKRLGTGPLEFIPPLTTDIVAWHRAAVVAAVDLKEDWSFEALGWIDEVLKKTDRTPSIVWQVDPIKEG